MNTRLASIIANWPPLIHHDSLGVAIHRILTSEAPKLSVAPQNSRRDKIATIEAGAETIGVILVHGVLWRRDSEETDYWGETTYEGIRRQFQAALRDASLAKIAFDIDSPGGDGGGLFDLVDEIYKARGTKPIYAMVNDVAYSGAYAIASAADRIYLTRTGGVGSVGVRTEHMDLSKFYERLGVTFTSIYSGDRKDDFSPYKPLTTEAREIAQKNVDAMRELFVATVARNRGLSVDDVRATEAAIYRGEEAVDVGFADAVVPWTEFAAALSNNNKKGGSLMDLKAKLEALKAEAPEGTFEETLAAMGYAPASSAQKVDIEAIRAAAAEQASKETEARVAPAATEKAAKETADRAAVIVEVCVLAGMEKMAPALIREGASVDEARNKVLDAKARQSSQTHIRSTVSAISTGEPNPLLADAQSRADKTKK